MRYLWLLYRKDQLNFFPKYLTMDEFKDLAPQTLLTNYDFAWMLEGQSKRGFGPVGILFGLDNHMFIVAGQLMWFPWASKRNILETMLKYFSMMKGKTVVLFTAKDKKKSLFAHIVKKYDLIRPVGSVYALSGGGEDDVERMYQTK